MYSFTKADRFVETGDIITAPKDTPGPKYNVPDVAQYKYNKSNKWRIGSASRKPLVNGEKYAYFNYVNKEVKDMLNYKPKWGKTVGGALGKDPRIKYDYREKTPGPGRYTPSLKNTRPKSANYFIGEKTGFSAMKLFTGTDKDVGPGKYRPETAKYHSHHQKFPTYSIGKGKRPPLNPKPWTKNESYWIYSSMGNQVQSKKRTEEMVKIGKSTREREMRRGTFKSMMERTPVSIRIPIPKF